MKNFMICLGFCLLIAAGKVGFYLAFKNGGFLGVLGFSAICAVLACVFFAIGKWEQARMAEAEKERKEAWERARKAPPKREWERGE